MALSLNLLTTSELSTLIKRAPETLIRWRRLRIGPPYIVIEGRVLYEEGEVRQWLVARRASIAHQRPEKSGSGASRTVIDRSDQPAPVLPASVAPSEPPSASPFTFVFDPTRTWEPIDG